jgi:hypothetical protein
MTAIFTINLWLVASLMAIVGSFLARWSSQRTLLLAFSSAALVLYALLAAWAWSTGFRSVPHYLAGIPLIVSVVYLLTRSSRRVLLFANYLLGVALPSLAITFALFSVSAASSVSAGLLLPPLVYFNIIIVAANTQFGNNFFRNHGPLVRSFTQFLAIATLAVSLGCLAIDLNVTHRLRAFQRQAETTIRELRSSGDSADPGNPSILSETPLFRYQMKSAPDKDKTEARLIIGLLDHYAALCGPISPSACETLPRELGISRQAAVELASRTLQISTRNQKPRYTEAAWRHLHRCDQLLMQLPNSLLSELLGRRFFVDVRAWEQLLATAADVPTDRLAAFLAVDIHELTRLREDQLDLAQAIHRLYVANYYLNGNAQSTYVGGSSQWLSWCTKCLRRVKSGKDAIIQLTEDAVHRPLIEDPALWLKVNKIRNAGLAAELYRREQGSFPQHVAQISGRFDERLFQHVSLIRCDDCLIVCLPHDEPPLRRQLVTLKVITFGKQAVQIIDTLPLHSQRTLSNVMIVGRESAILRFGLERMCWPYPMETDGRVVATASGSQLTRSSSVGDFKLPSGWQAALYIVQTLDPEFLDIHADPKSQNAAFVATIRHEHVIILADAIRELGADQCQQTLAPLQELDPAIKVPPTMSILKELEVQCRRAGANNAVVKLSL